MHTPLRLAATGALAALILTTGATLPAAAPQAPAAPLLPSYPPVFRTQCFPVDALATEDRALATEWLQAALDREPLYTILGDVKPISSAARTFSFSTETPDLKEVEQARRVAAALRCGEGITAHVQIFANAPKNERSAQIVFVNRPALDRLLARHAAFFAPLGLSPGTPPLQVLGVVEHLPREARFRGLGYLFGFPEYAVDFFVAATKEGADVGPGKDREFFSVPTHGAPSNAFVWAVPRGHKERAEDRAIIDRAAPVLASYQIRRERFVGEGKPGVFDLVRDWLCDESGMCGVDRAPIRMTAAPRDPAEPLTRARTLLRDSRPLEAAVVLKGIDLASLDDEGRRRHRLISTEAAIRTGDRAWLEQLNAFPERYSFANGYLILTAWGYLRAADTETARYYLGRVKDPDAMEDRERRRWHALHARIAELEAKPAEELEHLAWMVEHQSKWATPACQQCHSNPAQHGDAVTSFPLTRWWAGERYTAVVKAVGAAGRTRDEASARLAADPGDVHARMRLAFALRALGDDKGFERHLRELPWVAFPDRPYREPRDLITFP